MRELQSILRSWIEDRVRGLVGVNRAGASLRRFVVDAARTMATSCRRPDTASLQGQAAASVQVLERAGITRIIAGEAT